MKNLYTILFLLITLLSFGQIKFEPGYIIMDNGAKTPCEVKNRDWRLTPKEFECRGSEHAAPFYATLKNTTEVGVANRVFTKYTVDVEQSNSELAYLDDKEYAKYKTVTVFLELLVDGEIRLYKYYNRGIPKYFYKQEGGQPIPLEYKMYKQGTKILYNRTYKSTLQQLMGNRITQTELFRTVEYNDTDLVTLFRQYNGVTTPLAQALSPAATSTDTTAVTPVTARVTKGIVTARVGAGIVLQTLKTADVGPNEDDFDFGAKANAVFTVEGEWLLPFNRNKWGLFLGVTRQTYSNNGKGTLGTPENGYSSTWKADYHAWDFSVGGRYYMYLPTTARLFVNAGYIYSLNDKDDALQHHFTNTLDTYDREYKAYQRQSSVFAGAGVSWKKFALEARYYGKRDLYAISFNAISKLSGIGLLVTYSFP
jgi:hypothetical protein